MDYESAKEIIQVFNKVMITGPHRSGTRIATKIIAHDFGLDYVDEADVAYFGNEELIQGRLEKGNCAIQCGAYMNRAWQLPSDVLVVVMNRDPDDIRASELRLWELQPKGVGIDWSTNTNFDRARYRPWKDVLDLTKHAAVVKYEFYEKVFKKQATCAHLLLDYESLSGHEMWVDKSKRSKFVWDQTAVRVRR